MTRNKRAKSCSRNYPTKDPNEFIRMVWPETKGKARINAYAVDSYGKKIKGQKTFSKISHNEDDRERKIANLKALVIAALTASKKKSSQRAPKKFSAELDYENPMVVAFIKFKESGMRVSGWGRTTLRNKVTYFERNVLPVIQNYIDVQFDEEALDGLKKSLASKTIENGNSDHRAETAFKRAENHINDAKRIYAELFYFDADLPELPLLKGMKASITKKEQLKLIPAEIHLEFRKILEALIPKFPLLVRGAVCMDMGFRAAEAAALRKEEIEDGTNGMRVKVRYQEVNGERTTRLKRPASRRDVPFDEWAAEMIRKCNSYIDEGDDKQKALLKGGDLSTWVLGVLREAGCTEDILLAAQFDMTEHAEYITEETQSTDVSGHLLRRNRASLMYLLLGYDRHEVDVIIGHESKISKSEKDYLSSEESFRRYFLKNKRYDINGGVLCSSPKYIPWDISCEEMIEIVPFDEFKLKNYTNTEQEVFFSVDACVVGEIIEIQTNGKIISATTYSSCTEKDKKMANKELIGSMKLYSKMRGDD